MNEETIVTSTETVSTEPTAIATPVEAAVAPQATISSWRDSLGVDLKESKSLADYKDIESLARSHIHLQGMLGKKASSMNSLNFVVCQRNQKNINFLKM